VWTFRHTPPATPAENIAPWADKGDTKFSPKEFYKQFGVGTGFGFRFDFSFLVLRFDIGIKVYDPGRAENDRFVLNKVRFFKPYDGDGTLRSLKEPVIYNVGIGYPF
jgi:outer membrane protein insertion porin family